jgi:hypothetical protein
LFIFLLMLIYIPVCGFIFVGTAAGAARIGTALSDSIFGNHLNLPPVIALGDGANILGHLRSNSGLM